MRPTCPHCGNTNRDLMEDNGLKATSWDLTLLCVAPVKDGEYDSFEYTKGDADFTGLCGMQWEPNQAEETLDEVEAREAREARREPDAFIFELEGGF